LKRHMSVRQWFVIRSKPRKEAAATSMLSSLGIEVYLPVLGPRRRSGRMIGAEPLFPGYFFRRLVPHSPEIPMVNRTPNAHYVLRFGTEPCSVPDELVATIRNRLATESRRAMSGTFRSGEPVLIAKGPFEGVEAVFDGYLSASGRARVLITTLQSVCRAEFDVDLLRSASKKIEKPAD
jgi:transcriptional antiterminator RfaH